MMMNPQFPGQYGQGPPQNYGGQSQPGPPGPQGGPPGPVGGIRQPIYNGQPMTGPGQFGGPKSVPISNGPHVGPGPGQFGSGPQGDQPRMGGPGMIPPRGPAPPGAGPGQMGMPRGPSPQHMGQGPRPPVSTSQMTNQMTNQMGGMNLSGPPFRGQPPVSNNPPSSTPQGYGQPGRGPTPTSMGPGSGGMGYQPTSMGPAQVGAGPPSSVGMAPPTTMGMMPPSSMGMAPTSMGMGPPPTSLGPPTSMGPPPTSMGMVPPTGMGTGPPTSMGMAPPTRMGAPPTSTGMGPPSGMGAPPPGMGMRPPTSMGPPVSGGIGQPPGMGNPNYSGGQQDMGQGYNAAPAGIEMRPPSQPTFGPPPTSNMAGPNSPAAGYGQPPSFPPSSQYGGAPGGQPGYQQDQYMGGGAPQGYQGTRPGGPGMQPGPAMQPPQQKKLDPDQMPSPLQVIEDDKRNRSGVFSTAVKGAVPPLVTTPFITQDQGSISKKKVGKVISIDLQRIEPIHGAIIFDRCDFTSPETQAKILDELGGKPADVVLSDMAPSATGTPSLDHDMIIELCLSVLKFCTVVLGDNGCAIIKIWMGGDQEKLKHVMERMFRKVRFVKPEASRSDSAELFLVGQEYFLRKT